MKDHEGNSALHWAAMFKGDVEGAIAAAAALIATGCDPYALNNEGKPPAALVVQHQDVSSCAKLLEMLLGQPGGSGSRSASGDVARIASANATAAASGHAGSSEVGQLASRCSAPPLLEPEMALCPVCLEPGACFTDRGLLHFVALGPVATWCARAAHRLHRCAGHAPACTAAFQQTRAWVMCLRLARPDAAFQSTFNPSELLATAAQMHCCPRLQVREHCPVCCSERSGGLIKVLL